MPNKAAAKKQLRQNPRRRLRNRHFASLVKHQMKKFEAALEAKDLDAARKEFREAVRELDRVADKGIIHKKMAARKKSRLHKRLAALASAAPAAPSAPPEAKTE